MTRRAGYRLQGMGSREENRQSIQVSMQLRKLSPHDILKLPLLVIPNLFRELGVDLIQGRVHDLGREVRFFTAFSEKKISDVRSHTGTLDGKVNGFSTSYTR